MEGMTCTRSSKETKVSAPLLYMFVGSLWWWNHWLDVLIRYNAFHWTVGKTWVNFDVLLYSFCGVIYVQWVEDNMSKPWGQYMWDNEGCGVMLLWISFLFVSKLSKLWCGYCKSSCFISNCTRYVFMKCTISGLGSLTWICTNHVWSEGPVSIFLFFYHKPKFYSSCSLLILRPMIRWWNFLLPSRSTVLPSFLLENLSF